MSLEEHVGNLDSEITKLKGRQVPHPGPLIHKTARKSARPTPKNSLLRSRPEQLETNMRVILAPSLGAGPSGTTNTRGGGGNVDDSSEANI
ncbi:hypothetical protein GUJ93_ZPchr0004g39194 [Zizania palustris]|uniref:Uncharacterized protein n=1 Tax=Zizania palustris TaxID=103762 RepID=A0A8J5SR32_ZIZPA|nr:hypothetical protein GUJ93_ZPchr0004g39194 [Zizania palustris]